MKYIDPALKDKWRFESVLQEAAARLEDRYYCNVNRGVFDVEYNIGYSIRHRNPFCIFKVHYIHRGCEKVDQFILEMDAMDTDKSVEDLEKNILRLEDKLKALLG